MIPINVCRALAIACTLQATAAFSFGVMSQADIDFLVEDAVLIPGLLVTYTDGTKQLLYPEADAHWDNATNYGSSSQLNIKQGEKRAALIRFDLVKLTKSVQSAQFTFFVDQVATAGQSIVVDAISSDTWGETDVDRYDQPAEAGVIATISANNDTWYIANVTSQVSSAAAGDDKVTFKLSTPGENIYIPAREHAYTDFNYGDVNNPIGNSHNGGNLLNAYVLFSWALIVHDNPDAKTSKGVLVRERLVDALKHVMKPGNEPNAAGRLQWTHNPVAHALLLAKNTSTVWNALTTAECDRVTLLMKAMAFAGNWGYENDNNFRGFITLKGEPQLKTWNANHVEPYVGSLAAASMFFGGTTLDSHFSSYDYETFIAEVRSKSLNNVDWAWSQTNAQYTEYTGSLINIGTSVDGQERGSGYGINAPFNYHYNSSVGVTAGAGDPYKIFYNLAWRMYTHTSSDTVGTAGSLATQPPGPNPYAGEIGMLQEFNTGDAYGTRTDGSYAFDGWMNNIVTAASVIARGRWGEGVSSSLVTAMNRRMVVGSEDFRRKMTYGWNGRKNGQTNYTSASTLGARYDVLMRLWDSYVKPAVDDSGITLDSVSPNLPVAENLATGTSHTVWSDRTYYYTSEPAALQGLTYIRTPKNSYTDTSSSWLTLQISGGSADVYVCWYATAIPSWLSSWTNTGMTLQTDNGKTLRVFKKTFAAGSIVLPGNAYQMTTPGSFTYTVAIGSAN